MRSLSIITDLLRTKYKYFFNCQRQGRPMYPAMANELRVWRYQRVNQKSVIWRTDNTKAKRKRFCFMVFNYIFNNISVISWRSVLLMEETGGPRENHWPVASHWQIWSHNVVHLALIEIRTHNISGTDCIGSCKSNYHTITATTTPPIVMILKLVGPWLEKNISSYSLWLDIAINNLYS